MFLSKSANKTEKEQKLKIKSHMLDSGVNFWSHLNPSGWNSSTSEGFIWAILTPLVEILQPLRDYLSLRILTVIFDNTRNQENETQARELVFVFDKKHFGQNEQEA